jgi:hypothetical protein
MSNLAKTFEDGGLSLILLSAKVAVGEALHTIADSAE